MNKFLLTMQYNEDYLLTIFLDHYKQYFPPQNIFIIDHGSKVNLIPDGFNRIYIPRDRPFSEVSRLTLIKDIAHGLLQYYDLGVYADCDELISFEGVNLDMINEPITHVAGFEVFRNSQNKLIGLLNPNECKPLIFKQVPQWRTGFHIAKDNPSKLYIPMAHIRFLDPKLAKQRLITRMEVLKNFDKGENDLGVDAHWSNGGQELDEFYRFINQHCLPSASLNSFFPLSPTQVFNITAPVGAFISMPSSYISKGDWKIFGEKFYDLQDYFPKLI